MWDISSTSDEQKAALSLESSTPSHSVIVDVADSTAVEAALRETEDTLGPVSHLVQAAAIGSGKFGFPFTNLNDYRLKPVGSDTTESPGTRLKPSEAFPAQSRLKARWPVTLNP